MAGWAKLAIQTVQSKINEIRKVIRKVRAVINNERNENLANYLTFARIYTIPVIVFLIIKETTVAASILFFAASLTDLLDGYVARNHGHKTQFGEWLDPIADKLLVLIVIPNLGLSPWIILPIFFREIYVMIGRLLIINTEIGKALVVGRHGKYKAAFQYMGITYAIINFPAFILVMIAVMLYTIWSGIKYSWEFRVALKSVSR
jgi:CDP-diacylglycerol--glycerol-3-phosphate 3-phosphatidyltransferase